MCSYGVLMSQAYTLLSCVSFRLLCCVWQSSHDSPWMAHLQSYSTNTHSMVAPPEYLESIYEATA